MRLPKINRRLILFIVTAGIILWICWQARAALTPFFIGLALAYLLAPLVDAIYTRMPPSLRERGFSRPLAILAVYLLGLALLVGAISFLVPPILNQAVELLQNAPALYESADRLVQDGINFYNERNLPAPVAEAISNVFNAGTLQRVALTVASTVQQGLMATVGVVSNTVSAIVGYLVIPIWLFYILNDTGRVLHGAMSLIPLEIRADVEALRVIFDRVLSAYIRGQLLVALILGVLITGELWLLSVPYSLLLGFAAGALAIIPFLGTILGILPAVVVALIQDPQLALQVVIVYLIIQQVDNFFISPRVQGDAVALNPAIIMVVLVIGPQLMGPIGLVVAVPLTAILRDMVHYLYVRVGEEPMTPAQALTRIGYGNAITPLMLQTQVEKPALPA